MHQALPVMGGMVSQNVLNLADSVMARRRAQGFGSGLVSKV